MISSNYAEKSLKSMKQWVWNQKILRYLKAKYWGIIILSFCFYTWDWEGCILHFCLLFKTELSYIYNNNNSDFSSWMKLNSNFIQNLISAFRNQVGSGYVFGHKWYQPKRSPDQRRIWKQHFVLVALWSLQFFVAVAIFVFVQWNLFDFSRVHKYRRCWSL